MRVRPRRLGWLGSRSVRQYASGVIPVAPMLLGKAAHPPAGSAWSFELKYDGFRAIVHTTSSKTAIWSRNGYDLARRFPEFAELHNYVPACVVDAELCVLDERGHPRFDWMHRKDRPPATLIAFDVLRRERRHTVALPIEERRSILKTVIPVDLPLLLRARCFTDGGALLAQCEGLQLEGIVAKRAGSAYRPGRRTDDWLKIRTEHGNQVIRRRMENASQRIG